MKRFVPAAFAPTAFGPASLASGGAALLALMSCTQHAPTATSAATATTAPAARPARLSAATVVGAWSFDQTCASGDGMVLQPNGSVTMNENQDGYWGVDDDGRLVLLTQSADDQAGAPTGAAFHAFAIHAGDQDHLYSDDGRTPVVTAKRCPTDQAPPPND